MATDEKEMSAAIAEHWGKVFRAPARDPQVSEDYSKRWGDQVAGHGLRTNQQEGHPATVKESPKIRTGTRWNSIQGFASERSSRGNDLVGVK